ncbi:nicotinamide-nucleotide adenylyltransferase [Hyperthermus butylicus]|uniref:Nicotinamide-nucleotide adenylyltransferase n=1 Tax=Hyperthermus butylicus (strain DSM 5456 / JCM 9403 / PLM1-5) TaxID=415426 RepID=A2BN20_HYPBU|nr:nicotinamide-nucleotide adenylyltransferase [Hyperthermus butylicus]ABM81381.1 Nicotinamide-nucleotide adenylyltransferase [Hyperthermus butylicus DSM 5456]
MVYRGLFVGRFQPLHWGHIEVIRWALERVDELIIAIGSAQESHTVKNPFTAGERIEMVRLGLRDAGISADKVYIVPILDIEMNHVWPRYVELMVPRFSVVVARNPLVVRLFEEYGYKVLEPPAFSRSEYSATHIRELMLRGDNSWRNLVPPSVARFIDEIKGVDRLRAIASHD